MLYWPPSTFTVFVIAIVLFKSSASSDNPSSLLCSPGWVYINITDKCIKGVHTRGSNDDNLKYCNDLNASLVTIDSVEEDIEISKQLNALSIREFWIAGKTEEYWTNGYRRTKVDLMKSTNYSNLISNDRGIFFIPFITCEAKQCCIMVNFQKLWIDVECSLVLNFACEKRHISESSEFNPSSTMSDDIPCEDSLECSNNILQVIMAPRNLTLLANMLAEMNNKTEADRTFLSETEANGTLLSETEAERNFLSEIGAARTILEPKVNSVSSPSKPETSSLEPRPFVPLTSPLTANHTISGTISVTSWSKRSYIYIMLCVEAFIFFCFLP